MVINGKRVEDERTVPDTPHEETLQVVKAPQLLYIKVRDLLGNEVIVNVTESITMAGVCYKIKISNVVHWHWVQRSLEIPS